MDKELRDELAHIMIGGDNIDRDIDIYLQRQQRPPRTLKAIGLDVGLTQERIRQIYAKVNRNLKRLSEASYQAPNPLPHYTVPPHILIAELPLSVRSGYCFKNNNLMTVAQVLARGKKDILWMPNFGKKSMGEVEALFERIGVNHLWED